MTSRPVPANTEGKGRNSDKSFQASWNPLTATSPRSRSTSPASEAASETSAEGLPFVRTKGRRDDDDWVHITDPEIRRRIQNRNAQRKFREKVKESRQTAALEAENAQKAGYSYATPRAADFSDARDSESGLPWGGVSIKHVLSRSESSSSNFMNQVQPVVSCASSSSSHESHAGIYAVTTGITPMGHSGYAAVRSGDIQFRAAETPGLMPETYGSYYQSQSGSSSGGILGSLDDRETAYRAGFENTEREIDSRQL